MLIFNSLVDIHQRVMRMKVDIWVKRTVPVRDFLNSEMAKSKEMISNAISDAIALGDIPEQTDEMRGVYWKAIKNMIIGYDISDDFRKELGIRKKREYVPRPPRDGGLKNSLIDGLKEIYKCSPRVSGRVIYPVGKPSLEEIRVVVYLPWEIDESVKRKMWELCREKGVLDENIEFRGKNVAGPRRSRYEGGKTASYHYGRTNRWAWKYIFLIWINGYDESWRVQHVHRCTWLICLQGFAVGRIHPYPRERH